MKTIVALQGVGNSGKTTSIKKAYQLLIDAYPDATVEVILNRVEITVIININGALVGIESQGDPRSRLPKSLDHFVRVGCEVIVCATRSYGGTVEAVKALDGRYHIQWLTKDAKQEPKAQEIDNKETAVLIVEEVKAALSLRSQSVRLIAAE
jgi:hypothetical protein